MRYVRSDWGYVCSDSELPGVARFHEFNSVIDIDVQDDGSIWLEVNTGKDGQWSRTCIQLNAIDAEKLADALREAAEKSREIRDKRHLKEMQQEKALQALKELVKLEFHLKEANPEGYERRKPQVWEYAREVVEMDKGGDES